MDLVYSLPGFHQPLASMSHLAGALIFAWLSYYLLRPVWGCRTRFTSVLVFAGATVALLAISSTYHMFVPGGIPRAVMLRIDLVAIFILIAATFTPIHMIMFSGWRRWGILALIWSFALVGSLVRVIWFESISSVSNAILFLTMGWIGALTTLFLWQMERRSLILPCAAGGVFYTLGAVANAKGWPILIPGVWGPHETLHFAVLAGLTCHWWAVTQVIERGEEDWVIPFRRPEPEMIPLVAESKKPDWKNRAA